VLALDALILNPDRHAGNLLLEPEPDPPPPHLRLWSIDLGNARVGWPTDFLEEEDEVPEPIPELVLPVESVSGPAMQTAAQAVEISRGQLTLAVMEVTQVSELKRIIDVLKRRFERAPELVLRYLSSMTERSP
jgi:hypothetical protein